MAREGALPPRRPHVGFFATSSYLEDGAVMDRAAAFFSERGWQVSAGDSAFSREQRFAGPDRLRAGDFTAMATQPGVDLAVLARGGYGMTRLLEHLDFERLRSVGRPLVGYSDFTAFNLAFLARVGGISFQGPAASDFQPGAELSFNQANLLAALSSEVHEIAFAPAPCGLEPPLGLDVRGRLWGGNLAMVCSLLGTSYFPRVRGGILFLEDVNEPAYRIERMLMQLGLAGILGRQKALVLGDFAPLTPMHNDNGYQLADALQAVRSRWDLPIVAGLPLGHGRHRATLAVGAAGRLRVDTEAVRLSYRGHPRLALT